MFQPSIFRCDLILVSGRATLHSHDTVDGRNPGNHLGCNKAWGLHKCDIIIKISSPFCRRHLPSQKLTARTYQDSLPHPKGKLSSNRNPSMSDAILVYRSVNLDLLKCFEQKSKHIFSQMVVQNGDLSLFNPKKITSRKSKYMAKGKSWVLLGEYPRYIPTYTTYKWIIGSYNGSIW